VLLIALDVLYSIKKFYRSFSVDNYAFCRYFDDCSTLFSRFRGMETSKVESVSVHTIESKEPHYLFLGNFTAKFLLVTVRDKIV